MRTLIAVPSLSRTYGGPIAKARSLAAALQELGLQATVIGCGEAGEGEIGLPVLGRFHSNELPSRLGPLRRAVASTDIVHVLGFREPVSAFSETLSILLKKPLILEPVGTHRPRLRTFRLKAAFDRSVGSIFVQRARMIIATSRTEVADLIKDGVPAEKVRLRANGISIDPFLPLLPSAEARERLGVPAEARLVVALGRMIGLKGLWQIPEALAKLQADVWAFIGGPDEKDGSLEAVVRAARKAGVEDRVIVRPEGIWGEDKRRVLSAASVYCLPSQAESFGVAAAEAAAMGIPVVSSSVAGVTDWLRQGSSATFVYGDVDGLALSLQGMLESEARRQSQRDAERIRTSLSWPSIATEQVGLYEEVLADT